MVFPIYFSHKESWFILDLFSERRPDDLPLVILLLVLDPPLLLRLLYRLLPDGETSQQIENVIYVLFYSACCIVSCLEKKKPKVFCTLVASSVLPVLLTLAPGESDPLKSTCLTVQLQLQLSKYAHPGYKDQSSISGAVFGDCNFDFCTGFTNQD